MPPAHLFLIGQPLTHRGAPIGGVMYRGGYGEGSPPPMYAYAIMLYAYAYCLDAIDIMTKTSDKYD